MQASIARPVPRLRNVINRDEHLFLNLGSPHVYVSTSCAKESPLKGLQSRAHEHACHISKSAVSIEAQPAAFTHVPILEQIKSPTARGRRHKLGRDPVAWVRPCGLGEDVATFLR